MGSSHHRNAIEKTRQIAHRGWMSHSRGGWLSDWGLHHSRTFLGVPTFWTNYLNYVGKFNIIQKNHCSTCRLSENNCGSKRHSVGILSDEVTKSTVMLSMVYYFIRTLHKFIFQKQVPSVRINQIGILSSASFINPDRGRYRLAEFNSTFWNHFLLCAFHETSYRNSA